MSQQPSVTIVIPAYNEERFIGRCLDSCIDQSSAPEEIIVVNNRSTDNTASVVRRYQEAYPHVDIRLLDQNEYQGLAPTRNYGLDHAKSDVVGRIDADSIISNDWVEAIRRRFQDPAIDAASGPPSASTTCLCGGFFSGSTASFAKRCRARRRMSGFSLAPTWQSAPQRGRRSVILHS